MQHSYTWLVQSREGFDRIAGDTPPGRQARRIIRQKLAAYDGMPIYSELRHYGHPSNREWKQYFVPEDDQQIEDRCPFGGKTPERRANRAGSDWADPQILW